MTRRTRSNSALGLADAGRAFRAALSRRDYRENNGGYGIGSAGTIGAWAGTTAITSARSISAVAATGSLGVAAKQFFAYTCAGNLQLFGGSFPQNNAVTAKSIQNGANPVPNYCVDFMHYGTAFEVNVVALAGYYVRVTVDGIILGAAATSGSASLLPVTFPDARTRRIRLEMSGTGFYGVNIGPNDSLWKPPVRGPRVIVAGDSYTAGTGATYGGTSAWVRAFSNSLALDDVWSSGVGGTGYVNPGTSMKMRDRIGDVTGYAPDYVLWAMGHNDASYTAAQVRAEAAACFAAVAAACPNAKQIALSPLWGPGPSTFGAGASLGVLNARDGIKAAAAAAGIPFVDLTEMPLDATAASTTLSSTTTSGFATLPLTGPMPPGSTVHVGVYPAGERREITTVTGSGPYTATIKPNMTNGYAAGTPVTEVGQSFFTGSGRAGATTGFGNSDIFIGTDNAHPTQAGHDALGIAIATQVGRYILA